jgi:hypothetical protein
MDSIKIVLVMMYHLNLYCSNKKWIQMINKFFMDRLAICWEFKKSNLDKSNIAPAF